jgi:hypothetical protein
VPPQNICILNLLGRGFFLLLKERHSTESWPIESHDRAKCATAKHLSPESTGKGIFLLFKERHFKDSWPIESHDRAKCGIAKHLSPESTGKWIFLLFNERWFKRLGK